MPRPLLLHGPLALATLVVCLVFVPSRVYAQTFEGLGDLPGGSISSEATAVSADGRIVLGVSNGEGGTSSSGLRLPYKWENGTMTALPYFPGRFSSFGTPTGISDDGRIIVGSSSDDSQSNFVFVRWVDGEIERLSVSVATDGGGASAVSADGTVLVGGVLRYGTPNGEEREAFRWENGTSEGLGYLPGAAFSGAADVSADGSVVVGSSSRFINEAFSPFRWAGSMEMLPLPSGAVDGFANAVSADGSVVVGSAGPPLDYHAVRWTSAGAAFLPQLAGATFSSADAVSADGSVIVGAARIGNDGFRAWIWTEANGTRDLLNVLTSSGLDLDGWRFERANDLSDDGTVIVGHGLNPSGNREAFRINLGSTWAPAEDEIVPPDETYEVQFVAPDGAATVDLYLVSNSQSSGGARVRIAEGLAAAEGTFEWEVPSDMLSPSSFLIAVDASSPSVEVVGPRFRLRPPYRLARVTGTLANPEYELFRFSRHAFSFAQEDEVVWPMPYWDRAKNAYDNNVIGYDPLISPIGDVRYDEEYFYARTAAAHPTWEAFARAFGFAGTYASTATFEFRGQTIHQVNPNAVRAWQSFSGTGLLEVETGYNGACYGFAMAVLAGFGSPEAFNARWLPLTGQRTLADVPLTDEVRDAIHTIFPYQLDRRTERRAIEAVATDPVSPREVLAQLKARLGSDTRALDRVLVFEGSYRNPDGTSGEGAHAVVPIDLLDVIDLGGGSEIGTEDDGVYWIPVVDPNYDVNASPDSEISFVEIDSTASTWAHLELRAGGLFETVWTGGNTSGLYLSGLAIDALEPARPNWPVGFDNGTMTRVSASSVASRLDDMTVVRLSGGDSGLSGSDGEVSYRDGTLNETLPGGGALFPVTGRPSRPYSYVAPLGRYTVDLAPGTSGQSLLQVGDRRTLGVERLDGGAEAPADVMAVGGDTLSVLAGSAGRLRVNARLTVESPGGTVTRTYTADSLVAQAGLSVAVSTLADSTGFGVRSDAEVTYNLVLGQAGPGGRRSFYHANVTLPADASHIVQPNWPTLGDGSVTVSVDLDGDGDPDETFELENEGFPVANEDEVSTLPAVFALAAYPNPARSTATVEIALPETADVRAEVFDLLGRRVATLHEGLLPAGIHPLVLDATRLPAGVYAIRVATDTAVLTRRVTVVR